MKNYSFNCHVIYSDEAIGCISPSYTLSVIDFEVVMINFSLLITGYSLSGNENCKTLKAIYRQKTDNYLSGMRYCNITMRHCNIGIRYCNITMRHCNITIRYCNKEIRHCNITIRHCNIGIRHCNITMLHCNIGIRYCNITIRHCNITMRHCKSIIDPVLSTKACFSTLKIYSCGQIFNYLPQIINQSTIFHHCHDPTRSWDPIPGASGAK